MANLKIIWTTGSPFSSASIDKIGYQISSGEFNIYSGSYWADQSSSMGKGYRPATAEEIEKHWDVLHPMWTPEPGDKVIVTQDIGNWHNKRGTIVAGDGSDHYWIVKRDDDGCASNFMKKNQMILAPYEETAKPVETSKPISPESRHGFTIGDIVIPDCDNFKGRECIVKALSSSSVGVHCPSGAGLGGHTLDGQCPDNTGRWYIPSNLKLASKEEPETVSKPSTPSTPSIPLPKEGYVTVRVFTEEEFKSEDLWDTYGGKGHPTGWNSEGDMNKYLGTYLQIPNSDFRGHSFKYKGWEFRSTDYEVIHEGVESKPEPKVEAKVEPKEPEMKAQKFKVGDQVTYRSKASCDGYKWGGTDQVGYIGTIVSYKEYIPKHDCYKIYVTSTEGEYAMLESEFYEYDGTYLGTVTLGTSAGCDLSVISAGTANTTSIPLDTWGIHIHKTSSELKEVDELAKYNQAPITLHKKPKRKLIIANTY
jgi:hypothetical protein